MKKAAAKKQDSDSEGSDVDGDSGEEEENRNDIRAGEVGACYRAAADVANSACAQIVKELQPGQKIADLCQMGDKLIMDGVSASYKDKKIEKGVAFPTCISPNNCAGHNSPLPGTTNALAAGDLVKVDLGVHVNGYAVVLATTVMVPQAPPAAAAAGGAAPAAPAAAAAAAASSVPLKGRAADVVAAAHFAAECAHRLLKPGCTNRQVTDVIDQVAKVFHCQPLQGVLSHIMKRFLIDGPKVIISKHTSEHRVDDHTFEAGEVWAVDIVMSTGEGKAKEHDARPTVFKRNIDQNYQLKLTAARQALNEIMLKSPTFPFSLRALDPKTGRLGLPELVRHEMVFPYPVLYEKADELVAQVKFTVLILPNSTDRITSHTLPPHESQYKIESAELKALLATGTKRMKKNKKNKKKKPAKPAATTTATAASAAAPATTAAAATATAAPATTAAKPAAMDTSSH